MAMPDKNDNSTNWRSDVMRRMAAIHAELDRLPSAGLPAETAEMRAKELRQELAVLMKKFLG
jgi:hypothetical protein